MPDNVTKEIFGDPGYTYSREQAIKDGTFADVTKLAHEAGFKIPVAITNGVAALCEPSEKAKSCGQSFEGRLWDVLWMALLAIKNAEKPDRLLPFKVILREGEAAVQTVKMWISFEGDAGGKPAATILIPSEY